MSESARLRNEADFGVSGAGAPPPYERKPTQYANHITVLECEIELPG